MEAKGSMTTETQTKMKMRIVASRLTVICMISCIFIAMMIQARTGM